MDEWKRIHAFLYFKKENLTNSRVIILGDSRWIWIVNLCIVEKRGEIRIDYNKKYVDTQGKEVNGFPEYLIESEVNINNNWTDIQGYTVNNTFYPTENSELVLERVIKSTSKEGDKDLLIPKRKYGKYCKPFILYDSE